MRGHDHMPPEDSAPSRSQGAPLRVRGPTPGESSDQWSATFDAIFDMVCLLDRDGTVVRCNRSMTEFLGRGSEELAGKKCYELMHGSRTFFERCPYQEMLRTGRRESFELALGDHWYQVTADPFFGERGEIVGAVHIVRDITERRRTDAALAERSRWLVAISDLAVDLAALPGDVDLGRFLGARLRELTGAVAVAFSEYDPKDRVLATRAIEFQPGAVKTLTRPLARRLTGTRSPVSEDDYREILASSNATRATLTEASFGAIPPAVDATVRKLLGVDRFIGVAYVIEGALYGTSVIALRQDVPDPPREELATFASLAAVSLRRRRAEVDLARQTEQIDTLFALSADILGITDTEGLIHRVSPAWEATLGHPVAETEGHAAYEFIHPDDVQKTREAITHLTKDRPLVDFVNRQRHRDGSYRLIEWSLTRFEGQLIIAAGRDITAKVEAEVQEETRRRRAAAELRRTSAYNRSLLEASLDPFVTIGPAGMITDVNEATVTATGRSREELVGTDFAEYFTEPERARASYRRVFRDGAVRDYPLEIRHRDGSLTSVLYNASPYRGSDGEVAGVFAAARDVGELKRAEEEIRALNAGLERRVAERTRELDAANRELQEFVYSVAHDLRTPLRAVDGFSLTVLEDYGDVIAEQGRSDLQRVRAAAQSMGQLIDALLSLSRVGRLDVQLAQVDLSAIARRVVARLRDADPARQVEIAVQDGLVVAGDVAILDIVLTNLLGNAWKFTSARPEAHIEFREVEHDDGRAFLVRDDGAGFDPAYVDKLFSPFQRLHAADEFPGTGVGLATVARVLEQLGGTWWAEGEVGNGAAFYFALPQTAARQGDQPPRASAGQ
jgi:PAS domain S-box-containing protein